MAINISAKPQLLRQIAAHIFAEDSVDTITLVGTVSSEEERKQTACFIAALEPGRRLVNHLEVDPALQVETDSSSLEPEEDKEGFTDEDTYFPYFPPTDPVIARTENDLEILGGFAPTSMDERTVAASDDGQVGDESLADAVRHVLREDAATTDLSIVVHVRDGIVYLHGRVPDLVDSDDAVEVASRVPGVDEVIDLLTVAALEPHAGSSRTLAGQAH
jgi:hypothetical protein